MNWVLLIGAVWLVVAALVGVLIGRSIRLADRKDESRAAAEAETPNFVVDPAPPTAGSTPATTDTDTTDALRRAIPTARPPETATSIRPSERTPAPREPGHY